MDDKPAKKLNPLEPISFEARYDPDAINVLNPICANIEELNFQFPDGKEVSMPARLDSFEYVDVPASRWQAFKHRRFPKWLLWLLPVKYEKQISLVFKTYKGEQNETE